MSNLPLQDRVVSNSTAYSENMNTHVTEFKHSGNCTQSRSEALDVNGAAHTRSSADIDGYGLGRQMLER